MVWVFWKCSFNFSLEKQKTGPLQFGVICKLDKSALHHLF